MTSITRQILAHKGPHPDRLSMHTATLHDMIGEVEYIDWMLHRFNPKKPTFGGTPIYHDTLIDKDVVIFERVNECVRVPTNPIGDTAPLPFLPPDSHYETHRITLK